MAEHPPWPRSILETVLYAPDLDSARFFYGRVIGLAVVRDIEDLGFVCRVAPGQSLLVFDPRESDKPGRGVPIHGARGPGHVALWVDEADLDAWRSRLSAHGVAIEHEQAWGDAARSLYVRDPAGNSVELITGDIWATDPAASPDGPGT